MAESNWGKRRLEEKRIKKEKKKQTNKQTNSFKDAEAPLGWDSSLGVKECSWQLFTSELGRSACRSLAQNPSGVLRRYPQQHAVLFLVLAPPCSPRRPWWWKVEPWWNPGGTLVEPSWNPGPPRSLSGLRLHKLSAVGEKDKERSGFRFSLWVPFNQPLQKGGSEPHTTHHIPSPEPFSKTWPCNTMCSRPRTTSSGEIDFDRSRCLLAHGRLLRGCLLLQVYTAVCRSLQHDVPRVLRGSSAATQVPLASSRQKHPPTPGVASTAVCIG